MKPILVSSGEPAGVGPDLCLALAEFDYPVVVLGDINILEKRAKELNAKVHFELYQSKKLIEYIPGTLNVYSIKSEALVQPGVLNPKNATYVLELLTKAANLCANKEFSALVTAPIHKANINDAGYVFTGHTEFFATLFNCKEVVMMLTCKQMKVALVTTHLPLRAVPDSISEDRIMWVISQLHRSLQKDFGIENPYIKVAGLNPHAGESGHLGREEIEIIIPALTQLRKKGLHVEGPFPADTMFTKNRSEPCNAYVAMYHDQGLPVLKYAGFHEAVNVTLGLPIIRTSVDHGTALDLAGKNKADVGSLKAAVEMALDMVTSRIIKHG